MNNQLGELTVMEEHQVRLSMHINVIFSYMGNQDSSKTFWCPRQNACFISSIHNKLCLGENSVQLEVTEIPYMLDPSRL